MYACIIPVNFKIYKKKTVITIHSMVIMSLGRILLMIFVVSPMVIYIFCYRYLYGNHQLYLLLIKTILIQSTSIQVYFNSFG